MNRTLMDRLLWVANQIKAKNLPYSQQVFFNECKTPACIAGYCTQDPVFQAAGLRTRAGWGNMILPAFGPAAHDYIGTTALMQLLELSEDQADYIFGTLQEIEFVSDQKFEGTVDEVITRICHVINGVFA